MYREQLVTSVSISRLSRALRCLLHRKNFPSDTPPMLARRISRTLHGRRTEEQISGRMLFTSASAIVAGTNTEFLTEQHWIRGITRAPLRAAVRLRSFSTMQTVHSTATGHGSPGGTQHQLIYAPVWKSQRGDAIRLRGGLLDVTWR